jgi:ferritin-like protein
MSEYHEPAEELAADVRNAHRALVSLQEELEAVDWYQQRMAACSDPELRRVLEHNSDEEMEHAAMLLEWLRRNHPKWDLRLRRMLFTTQPLGPEHEGADQATPADADAGAAANGRGLGVGSLRARSR